MASVIRLNDMVMVRAPESGIKDFTPARVIAITNIPGKSVGVEFLQAIGAHSCDGLGKDKHCLWVLPESVYTQKEAEEMARMEKASADRAVSESSSVSASNKGVIKVDQDGRKVVVLE